MTVMRLLVAPYVGAWIETAQAQRLRNAGLSHPTWVRGLKQSPFLPCAVATSVAPYVGAWIETQRH